MKWRSSYLTELQKSLRPGAKAELVTARKMFGNRKSIGLGTIASYRMDPKQRMQRIHYAMACAKWGTLSSGDKAAYATWAEDNAVTVFSSFLHSYLSQLKEDLVMYLPMEKITGTTVKDYSKYGNDGTETDCTLTKDGFINNALDFNGTSSVVNCGTNTSLNITAALTLTTWVKWGVLPSAGPSWQVPITKGAINKGYGIAARAADDRISFTTRDGGGDYRAWSISPIITDVWYHICGVFDGTNTKLYINAQYQTQILAGIGDSATVPLRFGLDSWGNRFQGRVDETRIYKKALTPEEIRATYVQESKWHGDVA